MAFICRKKMKTTAKFTSTHAPWLSTVCFALAFYTVGAGLMDSFAMYHSWRFVGESEFGLMHQEAGGRIIKFYVMPALLMTVFLVLQFWHRPSAVPSKLVWIALACTMIVWISSIFIQIPIQFRLDNGRDEALLDWLIVSDWIRVIPILILAGIVLTMIKRTIS